MRSTIAFLSFLLLAVRPGLADIQTDWAYHAVGSESRTTEQVPGEAFTFLANGTDQVPDNDTVTIYLLTTNNFAGAMDEQLFVRWWDGARSHWVMGARVKPVHLDAARPDGIFRGLPTEGTVLLDLWKVEIPPEITQPGDNFYAIQLKGYLPDSSEDCYLLRQAGGDFSRTNNFGQIWSASEEFDGQDWKVEIRP